MSANPMKQVLDAVSAQNAARSVEVAEPELLVTFEIGRAKYAIRIDCVREVVEGGHVAPFPITADGFEGLLNLRGSLVPLIDGGLLLWGPRALSTLNTAVWNAQTRYVVLESEEGDLVGIRAAHVAKRFVEKTQIMEALRSETGLLTLDERPYKLVVPEVVFSIVEELTHAG